MGWQGSVVGGDYRGGFCEVLPEASSMSGRASARCLRDGPTLVKAGPVSDGSNASVTTHSRRKSVVVQETLSEVTECCKTVSAAASA